MDMHGGPLDSTIHPLMNEKVSMLAHSKHPLHPTSFSKGRIEFQPTFGGAPIGGKSGPLDGRGGPHGEGNGSYLDLVACDLIS